MRLGTPSADEIEGTAFVDATAVPCECMLVSLGLSISLAFQGLDIMRRVIQLQSKTHKYVRMDDAGGSRQPV